VATTPTSGKSTLPGSAAPAAPAEYEDIPVSNMRRTIGKRLSESKQQLPHYYLTVEVNMGGLPSSLSRCGENAAELMLALWWWTDRVMKLREMFNKAGDGKVKLSVNDFSECGTLLALE
jgi:pyruvate dehydrogenase E2 component (dihydrolipoamide acetyltransferase)